MSSFRGGSATPGEQVRLGDRYLLEHLIGQGGMAEVWSARDLVLERDVAVKLLLPRFREDDDFRARFRREAQHSAKLNHAHIVAVYDTGVHDGLPFIVMERVTGRSLQDILSHGGLTEERSLEICADVCAALENAHRRSLVHRDVKPGNILLADDGMVKVTDFGIARALDSETITETVAVLGTAAYLSPEQAQGAAVDERSDIYSLGIVLYEMLTGRQPFQGDTAVGVAYQHVQEVPPPPREWDPTISPAAEAITMKALSKNPANRYASAQEMREDILRARAAQPVTAPAVLSPDETAVIDADVTRARPPLTDTQERRRHLVGYAMLALLTIAAFAAGIWLLASVLDREETLLRTVPEVIGQAPQAAQTMLEARGLEGRFVGESHSASIPKGRVVGQNPDPGMQVADGSIVELTLSAGPEPVTVPAVEGEAEQDAIVILREAGLTVGDREDEYSDDIPSGHAIGTNPPAGRTVERGSSVTLIVSAGEESEFVPNVTGLLESDARFQLEDRGFRVLIVSEHSDNVDEGRVIRQDPSGNTRERVGSEVTIVVSLGPEAPDEPEPEPEPEPPDEEEPPPDEEEPPPDDDDDDDEA
jgi:eukaryotic-like serine/threonine-protein kinase